uniref:Ribonuclease P protein subunit p30 n=1 Tax=Rhabditophanes sp. KR3021 TaxID=114890 RepID=A0AC35TTN5_9BILA
MSETFADLNIRYVGNKEKTVNLVRRAIKMGYSAVAINIDVGMFFCPDQKDSNLEPPAKKAKKKNSRHPTEEEILPEPFVVDEKLLDLTNLDRQGIKFRQYSRLTCDLTESTSVFRLQNNPKVAKFDIVAVRPQSLDILTTIGKKGTCVDIITCDHSEGKAQWLGKSKALQAVAYDGGLTFEIIYSSALRNREARQNLITNSRLLFNVFNRGKNVILSSGAEEISELRGPYDTINITCLFGVEARFARKFVTDNTKLILQRSASRATIKCSILEVPLTKGNQKFGDVICLDKLSAIPFFDEQISK